VRIRPWLALAAVTIPAAVACGSREDEPSLGSEGDASAAADGAGEGVPSAAADGAGEDAAARSDGATDGTSDGTSPGTDSAAADSAGADADVRADGAGADGGTDSATAGDAKDGASGGVLSGGPCASGAAGATAYRVRWVDAGGAAQVSYEVDGLPDKSRDHAGAYGYQIGFVPPYVDPFLAQGGLGLGADDFIDLEMSTVGVAEITNATLAVYGRSYSVDTNGSFNWQTFDGTGSSPIDLVSNVPPYAWYKTDMTTEIRPGDANVLVRVKAGPSSGALVVNRLEICMVAR
jgi:hypothetical protein